MKKILVAGEGGQGVQSLAEIITKAAFDQGKSTTYIPSFGVEQRGGVSLGFVQIDDVAINYPKFTKADIIVAMSSRSIDVIKPFINDNTLLIYDSSFIADKKIQSLQGQIKNYLNLPAKLLTQDGLSLKVANIIFLGAIAKTLSEVPPEKFKAAMDEKFKNHPEFAETNSRAFEVGLKYATEKPNQEFKGSVEKEIIKKFEDEEKSWERFPEYCKGCSLCIVSCPPKAIQFTEDLNFLGTNLPIVDLNKCVACGACQKICPDGAIKVNKK